MNKKILVVDDNPEIVDLLKNRLEFNQFDVATAADGQEAVKKARQFRPELILMDVSMPNLDGGEAVRIIRADVSIKNIPVIFVTATLTRDDGDYLARGINVDGEDFNVIAKPINPKELLSKINELLSIKHD